MNTSKNCLNCGTEVSLNFCPKCGQKTTIHRYSFAHFVEHDLVHGIWHLDKGILFTIKKLLLQPGHSIREFLQGKRVNYFNVITLLILIMGLSYFLNEASPIKITDLFSDEETKKAMSSIEKFSKEYPKLQLLLFIPVYSLFSFLWF